MGECMRVEEVPVAPPGDEEVVVEVRLLGLDAFIRTMMDGGAAFHGSTKIGDPLVAFGVGIVTARGASVKELEIGQRVTGVLMAQTVATVPAAKVKAARDGVSDAEHLHLLGLTTGLTAWAGVNWVSTALLITSATLTHSLMSWRRTGSTSSSTTLVERFWMLSFFVFDQALALSSAEGRHNTTAISAWALS